MRSGRGAIAVGCSRTIPISRRKLDRFSISMLVSGRANRWRQTTTSCRWAYLTAWDVRRAKLFGRCEPGTGIAPFDRLVAQVMAQDPYRSARRVFWVVDNGSGHRGPKAVERLQRQWPNLIPVFTPVHASWLNQVEIYFSIVQRKVLTPGDFADLAALEAALLGFQARYETVARPFEWTFTRQDLIALLTRLALAEQRPAA